MNKKSAKRWGYKHDDEKILTPVVAFPIEDDNGVRLTNDEAIQIVAHRDQSYVLTRNGHIYSWGSPKDRRRMLNPLGRQINESRAFDVTTVDISQLTKSSEPGRIHHN
jgi:alpha-tubulin suppressor-like RCC1 family protein